MKMTNSGIRCVMCEQTIVHSEMIYKMIIGTSALCHGCLADAKLGRLVRKMPVGEKLTHLKGAWDYSGSDDCWPTALEALERAMGEGK